MQGKGNNSIGIYVRESRDDGGENIETIENQRDLLLDYVEKHNLGRIYAIYTDDNVSGSAFERIGLDRLKEDVMGARINLLLLKDLSRLGRNNAKTLQFIDFLEEFGVRIISSDGRYDSLRDNDTVGIETWFNERYVRDISRKIRSSLHFKIQRGEYIGHAPFGYRKAEDEKNRLCIHEAEAEIVRQIYRLYRSGMGYTSIASSLNEEGCPSPGGQWNRITVRRILCSRVYVGDTVQGISEKISFKSKKTRRLPQEEWVITERTHKAIIPEEEFRQVQRIREEKGKGRTAGSGTPHVLNGLMWCGGCGSAMYARKRTGARVYICGNYFRNGKTACSSHTVSDCAILERILGELSGLFAGKDCTSELFKRMEFANGFDGKGAAELSRIRKQLAVTGQQQEMLYMDRLENRISEELFLRMNGRLEEKLGVLERERGRLKRRTPDKMLAEGLIEEIKRRIGEGQVSGEMVRMLVSRITVYDPGDNLPRMADCSDLSANGGTGMVIIDFRISKEV